MFLVDGTTDNIVTVELMNWSGKGIKIPRTELAVTKREDIRSIGVYFLFCKDDEGMISAYIGEAENIYDRLMEHIHDYQNGKEKFYWQEAYAFIGHDLNKASIRHLENRLVEIARSCKRYDVLTKNTYKNTVMKESHVAVLEEFINNIRILLNLLGYRILEPIAKVDADTAYYFCSNKRGADAKGFISPEGFVVLQGSKIAGEATDSFKKDCYFKLQQKLIEDGIIKDGVFQQDYLFNSPSAASSVCLSLVSNGNDDWKNSAGYKLKDAQMN